MLKKIMAAFCAVVFSAMLAGCGTKMGEDISSDISSMMPDTNDSSYQSSIDSQNNNTSPETDTSSKAKISKERAKEIALKHAKLKESDITDYEIDLDNENGKLVYEISFESNGKEYDYDVDATTGDVSNSMYELID